MSEWVPWYQLQWGMRLYQAGSAGLDVIQISSVTVGPPESFTINLRLVRPVTWPKSIALVNQANWGPAWANEGQPEGSMTIPVISELLQDPNTYLEFSKAAFLGIQTGMYKLGDVMRCVGKIVTFDWLYDFGGPLPPEVPAPSPPVPWP